MLKKICFLVSLSLFAILSSYASGLETVIGKVTNGYNYWFYTPHDISAKEGKPLVIFLHGRSLCGTDLNKVRRYGTINAIEKGREIDAYVIAPQNPGESWKPEKIMNVVDYVCANHNVDTDRIYVLGMSLGGYGAIDLAASYPDRIAAAIGMCGGATVKNLSGLARTPLWIIHGTGDASVPVSASDKVVAAVKEAQKDGVNRLHYDRISGMNHSQPARVFYKPEVYDWLFSHSLKHEGRPINPTVKVDSEFLNTAYKNLDHSKGYKAKSSSKAATASKAAAKSSSKSTASVSKKSKKSKAAATAKSEVSKSKTTASRKTRSSKSKETASKTTSSKKSV